MARETAIYLTVHLDGRQRKTLWRLGMLNHPAFRDSIVSDLNSYLQDNDTGDVNPSILWDAAKAVLRGKIIARTSMLKKIKATKLSKLQEELIDLEQTQIVNKESSIINKIRNLKQEIDQILSEEVEKNISFMKQRYYDSGPKATKLLAWRLRKQQAENTIHKIRDPATKKITTSIDGIQTAFVLGKEINDKLVSPITVEEIEKAITSLNANKSPGTDGFPPEWCKSMKDLLPLLVTCFN